MLSLITESSPHVNFSAKLRLDERYSTTQIKKESDRDSHVYNNSSTINDHNHCVEIPRVNSSPAARDVAKSLSELKLDVSR